MENINCNSTYFVKLTSRNPYVSDWVECVIQEYGENYLRIIPCDDNYSAARMNFTGFQQLIMEGKAVEKAHDDMIADADRAKAKTLYMKNLLESLSQI